jgi:hypothetical protein
MTSGSTKMAANTEFNIKLKSDWLKLVTATCNKSHPIRLQLRCVITIRLVVFDYCWRHGSSLDQKISLDVFTRLHTPESSRILGFHQVPRGNNTKADAGKIMRSQWDILLYNCSPSFRCALHCYLQDAEARPACTMYASTL